MRRQLRYVAVFIALVAVGTGVAFAKPYHTSGVPLLVQNLFNSSETVAANQGTGADTIAANSSNSKVGNSTKNGSNSNTDGHQHVPTENSNLGGISSTMGSGSTTRNTSGSKSSAATNTTTEITTEKSGNSGTRMSPGGASGSTFAPPTPHGDFTIVVSEYHQVLQKKEVPIVPNESLLEYTEQNFLVETAYEGQFIIAIDGIKSKWTGVPVSVRQSVDWFIYINEQEAPVGAGSVIPRAGDVDIWDYHSWDPSTGRG